MSTVIERGHKTHGYHDEAAFRIIYARFVTFFESVETRHPYFECACKVSDFIIVE